MTTKIESVKNVFVTAARNEEQVKEQAKIKVEHAQNDDEKNEHVKLMKRAATHERYNDALASMSDKAIQTMLKLKIDSVALAAQSRELKKRSIAILEALASDSSVTDRALDAVLQRLAAKRDSKLTLVQIQREMSHETTTQAQYFKTCALFFNFAQYNKADKEVSFDYDAQVLKSLMNIYSK